MINLRQYDDLSRLVNQAHGIADTLRRAYSARENHCLNGAAWALQDLLEQAQEVLRKRNAIGED